MTQFHNPVIFHYFSHWIMTFLKTQKRRITKKLLSHIWMMSLCKRQSHEYLE